MMTLVLIKLPVVNIRLRLEASCAAFKEAVSDSRDLQMLNTKEWLETHVAIDMTPRLISEASKISRANCSRIGIRIFLDHANQL